MTQQQKQAFTLVELIVVITILAILGTIAFISLAGYSKDARNSVRLSDTKNVETSLELFSIGTGKYPTPSNAVDLTASGSKVGEMGTIGESVITTVKQISQLPLDPKSEEEYGYSIVESGKSFQIKAELEDSLVSTTHQVQAADGTLSKLTGNYNDMYVVSENGEYFTAPSLFPTTPNILTADFVLDEVSEVVTFQAETLGTSITSDFVAKLQTAYSGSTFTSKGGVFVTLAEIDSSNTGALLSFGTAVENGGDLGDNESNGGEEVITPSVPTDPYWNNVSLALNFEDGAVDVTGKHTPSLVNGAVIDVNGTFNNSLTLDGVSGYLSVPAHTDFQFADQDFTVEFFFTPGSNWPATGGSGNHPALIGTFTGGGGDPWLVQYDAAASVLKFVYSTTGGNTLVTAGSSETFTIGTPYHIVYQRNGDYIQSFVNGVLRDNTNVGAINIFQENIDLRLGSQGPYNYNDGTYDDVRITKGIARYGNEGFDIPTGTIATSGPENISARYWRIYSNELVTGITNTSINKYWSVREIELFNSNDNTGTNLALGSTITASNTTTGNTGLLNDSATNAWWETGQLTSAGWIQFDIGTDVEINSLNVIASTWNHTGPVHFPSSFVLQYSDDASTWINHKTFSTPSISGAAPMTIVYQ